VKVAALVLLVAGLFFVSVSLTRAGLHPAASNARQPEAKWGNIWAQPQPTTTAQPTTTTAMTYSRMLGEYGVITDFTVTDDEARLRVRQMVDAFNVREFQFYDAMEAYSHPPSLELDQWRTLCMNKTVHQRTIRVYLDEIRRHGGRSWLYVQAMAADLGDEDFTQGFEVIGMHFCYDRPVLQRIVPNAAWAKHITPQWVDWAKSLGFDGIHWDTLGADGNLPGFLLAASPILKAKGLLQSSNFVDGAGWKDFLLRGHIVEFPYWEIWQVPVAEDRFFELLEKWHTGVYVSYPGNSPVHNGEPQNIHFKGVFPLDIIVKRWQRARRYGGVYLAIVDGLKHLQTAYLPYTIGISLSDINKIRHAVFDLPPVDKDILGQHAQAKESDPAPVKVHPKESHSASAPKESALTESAPTESAPTESAPKKSAPEESHTPAPAPEHKPAPKDNACVCGCGWASPGTCWHDDGSCCFSLCCQSGLEIAA